ncbi:MAG: hypothetical protein SOH79_10295 [Heyndrickxia faecalis]|uniref:Uncharacterized protein n=1 Tax=Heyndrickxia faecalis TaxID=2824910 RepID=A0AAU7WDS0_9BACI|nr:MULTISPECIES: hypothetical protein [Heyndrickxia]NWN95156.1 hypothetical protein [Bacillus sp. (in: firmicutes)]AVD55427.1 hypothetical protein C3766_04455 [Heyndrickxia coagulans]AWP36301.1 hypothetical protein CYJ15_04590 [Heyndrickxia coagulans]KGT39150.1 hypothetical protein P421_06640 [Heyndrickxia coagulans P38]MBQ4909763.1 hypothetical protein [Heyndrickxia faecalis]
MKAPYPFGNVPCLLSNRCMAGLKATASQPDKWGCSKTNNATSVWHHSSFLLSENEKQTARQSVEFAIRGWACTGPKTGNGHPYQTLGLHTFPFSQDKKQIHLNHFTIKGGMTHGSIDAGTE